MGRLRERRILVIEDEPVLAMDVEAILQEVGCVVVAPIPTIEEALNIIRKEKLDGAILDLNVSGKMAFAAADALADAQIPFLIMTGHGPEVVPPRHRHRPYLAKPCQPATLLKVLGEIVG